MVSSEASNVGPQVLVVLGPGICGMLILKSLMVECYAISDCVVLGQVILVHFIAMHNAQCWQIHVEGKGFHKNNKCTLNINLSQRCAKYGMRLSECPRWYLLCEWGGLDCASLIITLDGISMVAMAV